jgi:hypothetical protein
VIVWSTGTPDIIIFLDLNRVKAPDCVIEHRSGEETHIGHGFLGITGQNGDCDYSLSAQHTVHFVHHAIDVCFPRSGREFVQEAEAVRTIERAILERESPRVRVCQSEDCALSQLSLLCDVQAVKGCLHTDYR